MLGRRHVRRGVRRNKRLVYIFRGKCHVLVPKVAQFWRCRSGGDHFRHDYSVRGERNSDADAVLDSDSVNADADSDSDASQGFLRGRAASRGERILVRTESRQPSLVPVLQR